MAEHHARIDRMRYSDMERIHRLVREAVELGQSNPSSELTEAILGFTAEIIEIVQGDKKMNKNQFVQGIVDVTRCHPEKSIEEIVEMFDGKVPLEADLIDRYYEMDPETEDVIINGTLVVDGMKILLEDPLYRVDTDQTLAASELAKARMRNRWCTVEASRIARNADGPTMLEFVGAYEDGVKRKWSISVRYAWIVKKDSIPRIDEILDTLGEEKFTGTVSKVLELLKTMPSGAVSRYSVKIGGMDVTIPSDQYILCEGEVTEYQPHILRKADIADTEIFDENGLSVLSGTVHDVQSWAMNLPSDSDYLGYRLRYGGTDRLVKVRDFLVKPVWDGKDRTDIYGVLGSNNSLLNEGTKEQVLAFLDGSELPFLKAARVFYGDSFGDSIPAVDFVDNNRTEQGGDC